MPCAPGNTPTERIEALLQDYAVLVGWCEQARHQYPSLPDLPHPHAVFYENMRRRVYGKHNTYLKNYRRGLRALGTESYTELKSAVTAEDTLAMARINAIATAPAETAEARDTRLTVEQDAMTARALAAPPTDELALLYPALPPQYHRFAWMKYVPPGTERTHESTRDLCPAPAAKVEIDIAAFLSPTKENENSPT